MGTILDPDAYGPAADTHEGYAAQVLDDGTITGEHSDKTEPRMIGQVVAACDCGWAGTTRYPCPEQYGDPAEELALAEWERDHAIPVLAAHRRAQVLSIQQELRKLSQLTLDPDNPSPAQISAVLAAATRIAGTARELQEQQEQLSSVARAEPPETTGDFGGAYFGGIWLVSDNLSGESPEGA